MLLHAWPAAGVQGCAWHGCSGHMCAFFPAWVRTQATTSGSLRGCAWCLGSAQTGCARKDVRAVVSRAPGGRSGGRYQSRGTPHVQGWGMMEVGYTKHYALSAHQRTGQQQGGGQSEAKPSGSSGGGLERGDSRGSGNGSSGQGEAPGKPPDITFTATPSMAGTLLIGSSREFISTEGGGSSSGDSSGSSSGGGGSSSSASTSSSTGDAWQRPGGETQPSAAIIDAILNRAQIFLPGVPGWLHGRACVQQCWARSMHWSNARAQLEPLRCRVLAVWRSFHQLVASYSRARLAPQRPLCCAHRIKALC